MQLGALRVRFRCSGGESLKLVGEHVAMTQKLLVLGGGFRLRSIISTWHKFHMICEIWLNFMYGNYWYINIKEYQGNWQAILVASPCIYLYIYIYMNMRQLYEQLLSRCLIMKCYEQWIVIMEEIYQTHFFLSFECHEKMSSRPFQGLSLAWPPLHRAAHRNDVRGIQQLVEDPRQFNMAPSTCVTSWQSSIVMEYAQCLQETGWKDGGLTSLLDLRQVQHDCNGFRNNCSSLNNGKQLTSISRRTSK